MYPCETRVLFWWNTPADCSGRYRGKLLILLWVHGWHVRCFSLGMDSLPYDVLIEPSSIWYGPSGTLPKSRDWQRWEGHVSEFFSIITRPDFDLNVVTWLVRDESDETPRYWDTCLFCGEPFDLDTDAQLAAPHWPYCSSLCACRADLDSEEDDI